VATLTIRPPGGLDGEVLGLGDLLGEVDGLGDLDGDVLGLGDVDGDFDGLGEDLLGEGDGTMPVHGAPLTRQLNGLPPPDTSASNVTDRSGPIVALYGLLPNEKTLFGSLVSLAFFASARCYRRAD
jgi:hypothetical protein